MTITTSTDQSECIAILDALAVRESFKPNPPNLISDSMTQLDPTTFLVGTNDRRTYTLHVLEDCTQSEAFDFLKSLAGNTGQKHINTRLEYVGAGDGSQN